jgi:hypothetical protein
MLNCVMPSKNKTYRNMRVLMRPSDVVVIAELRGKLQQLEPGKAITDSDVIRKAIRIANSLATPEPQRGAAPHGAPNGSTQIE